MTKGPTSLPVFSTLSTGLLAVAGIGVLDFLTGEYSLLIFYALPVGVVGWRLGRWGVVATSFASGVARWISDYLSHSGAPVSAAGYWNLLQDVVFLLLFGLLLVLAKTLMSEDGRKEEDKEE
ncbi:hypothetical protein L4X63_02455 [Geomonas sp. Red32]|uniref:hypothetical protein n=1 Tax=Geomonas sp. Red32 TaxID=2912856 RepID=UPI00202CD559|nr:hypothetical protein [Geomonas sp. Red32]MCM0080442.1 hypothetical protein [Geomonas sp. Red32]